MPCEKTSENRGRYWLFSGDVSAEEIKEVSGIFQGDYHFDETRYLIVDFSSIQGVEISEDDVEEIAATGLAASTTNPHLKIAIVTSSEELKKLALYYKSESPFETETFENLGDARSWIGKNQPSL